MSSPDVLSPIVVVARWLPLRQRVTVTVYLTLVLALLFGIGVIGMAQLIRAQTDTLARLTDASKAVRGFRTNIDAMQFAAHRFIASNHGSAVDQVARLYAEVRASLTNCRVADCVDTAAQPRLEQLERHLERFYQAFHDAVDQRNLLRQMATDGFESALARVRAELPPIRQELEQDVDFINMRAIDHHLKRFEEAIDALLYTTSLESFSGLEADFACQRGHLANLPASTPKASIAAMQQALDEMESSWLGLLQRARSYLFLVNVVMAGDAHEMQVIADRLEQEIDAEMLKAYASTKERLTRFVVVLILLLLLGSLTVFAIGRLMALSVASQLRMLTRTFNELAAGSQARIDVGGPHNDELAELGRAAARFRDVNARVSDLLQRYQTLNAKLEAKVAERTQALEESNRQLEQLARTDRLTGVLNRGALEPLILDEVNRSHRYQRALSLLFIDLDHFKVINDRYGHEVGDNVLVQFTRELQPMLRAHDRLGRWGGEEFLILCSETEGEDARALAERIRKHVEGLEFEQVGQVTLSIGIATLASGHTVESLIAEADQAMYRAKTLGRNRSVLSSAQ